MDGPQQENFETQRPGCDDIVMCILIISHYLICTDPNPSINHHIWHPSIVI